jgi:hypothetical protein
MVRGAPMTDYTPTAGDTPLYDAEAVVVPMRGPR